MLITEKSKKIARHYLTSSVFSSKVLIKWLAIASLVGVIVGVIASAFGHALIAVNNFRAAHPMIILGLPFAGLLIVFLYRYFKDQDDRGTNMVIA
ncbi:MAG: chloride channel protein, partial [Clostridia bacterium]|nr:chloride channel protein [Clostridia bacterium]